VEYSGQKYYEVPAMNILLKNNEKICVKSEEKIKLLKNTLKTQKDGFVDINGEYVAISYIAGIFNIKNNNEKSVILIPINK
jgi:hypothetical protein